MGNSSICMDLLSMRKLLEVIGGDIRRFETRDTWLWRVSRLTGLHYRVIRAIWHGEQISFESAYKLKLAAKKNDEYLIDRLLWNRAVLEEIDPEFYREQIDNLGHLADRIRGFSKNEG